MNDIAILLRSEAALADRPGQMERLEKIANVVESLAPCPAISPSDRRCIGRAEWHEVHADGIGTSWRDWAGKKPGVQASSRAGRGDA